MKIRTVTVPAWEGLRMYRGTALLLLAVVAVSVAAVLPVLALRSSRAGEFTARLVLTEFSSAAQGLLWGGPTRSPATTQQEGVGALFRLLVAIALATGAAGGLSVLTLFAARASLRSPEFRVRRAVGAPRRTILASVGLEALAIGFVALLAGGLAGAVVGQTMLSTWPGGVGPAATSLTLAIPAAAVVGLLLSAWLPLILVRRGPIAGPPPQPLQLWLPAIQLGLGLIALTAGALVGRRAADVMALQDRTAQPGVVYSVETGALSPSERGRRYGDLLDLLARHPGYDTISLTSPGALVGLGTVSMVTTDCGSCSQGGLPMKWHLESATHQFVSADSFHALGVHLLAGRGIDRQDRWDAPRVAVVSRGLAIRHFQNGEAIGRQMLVGDDVRTWHTVVGIVDDPPITGFGGALQPPFTVYLSVLQHPVSSAQLLIRSPRSPPDDLAVATVLRMALGTRTPLPAPRAELELVDQQQAPLEWFARWFGLQGRVMLGLSAAGIYALMRLWVLSLSAELGLRRAVGARRVQILGLVLGRAVGVGLSGVGIALWFGPSAWEVARATVMGLPAWDGQAFAGYAVLLVAISTAGAWFPAWWAAKEMPGRLLASEEA